MTIVAVLAGAVLLSLCSVVVGQAIWRLAGFERWSWLSGPVGLAALVALAGPAADLGDGTGVAVALVIATLTALVLVGTRSSVRPAEAAQAKAVLVLALTVATLPFIAVGHTGILAVTDNADFYAHVMLADGVRAGTEPVGLDPAWFAEYPTGPHALVGGLATLLGVPVDAAFTSLLMAILAMSALAAAHVLRDAGVARRVLGAAVVGIPYLAASYTAQTSFKETLLGVIVLSWALAFPIVFELLRARPLAALPLVALAAGGYADYGIVALGWLTIVTLAILAAKFVVGGWIGGLERRTQAGIAVVAVAMFVVLAAVSQLDQAKALIGNVEDIAQGNTLGGNVRAELPAYQVLGVWPKADLRETSGSLLVPRALAALALGAAAWAAWWWWRRERRPELPAAVVATLAVYVGARLTATPYYSGKALAVAAFAAGAMTLGALVLALRRPRAPLEFAGVAVGVVVLAAAAWSSALTLRGARVDPVEHTSELESFRGTLRGKPTLYLGKHNYLPWILRGVPVAFPAIDIGRSQVELVRRPEKGWSVEQPFDFDHVTADGLDRFDYVLGPRTAFASAPPGNWRSVRRTRSYELWRRSGATEPRQVLQEAAAPGARLDCTNADGAALARATGGAAVRSEPVVLPPPPGERGEYGFTRAETGSTLRTSAELPSGTVSVAMQYVSPTAVEVRIAGRRLVAPPSMEGPGAFWHVGEIDAGGRADVVIEARRPGALAAFRTVLIGRIAFTRAGEGVRVIPIDQACDKYVDWYRAGPGTP